MNKPNAYCCLCQQEVYVDDYGFCPTCKSQKGIGTMDKYCDKCRFTYGFTNCGRKKKKNKFTGVFAGRIMGRRANKTGKCPYYEERN